METSSNSISRIESKLSNVFIPSSPISTPNLLKGREEILQEINVGYRRKGASIVLYGERGVGKTSIVKVVAKTLKGNHFYYSADGEDTFETIAFNVLKHYNSHMVERSSESTEIESKDASVKIPIASGKLAHSDQVSHIETPISEQKITSQEIANRLQNQEGLIIIDDFERIKSAKARAKFADLIKKFSDNEILLTILIVGIGDNLDELLGAHESIQRNIIEIKTPRLSNDIIKKIVTDGFAELTISIDSDCIDQIVEFSANFPHFTHLMCEGATISLINKLRNNQKQDYSINVEEIRDSISYAISHTQYSIQQAYETAITNIRESQRFKYTLYAIASWPAEPVAYRDITKWVGGITKTLNGVVNVSHQLKSLEKVGIIQRTSKGYYRFKNPILKAYVILKARADTPLNELTEFDAHLSYVRKKLDRVKERI
ncbi:MAG: AAA family ATPase [bacterium]